MTQEEKQTLQELRSMLKTGLISDPDIIQATQEEIARLEAKAAPSSAPPAPKEEPMKKEKQKEETPKEKPPQEEKKPPRPASKKKKPARKKARPKKAKTSIAYHWKNPVDLGKLEPVVIHCQHYQKPVTEEISVKLKGTGSYSNTVKAKPGEHLIFDDKGHLVYIMAQQAFQEKCIEQMTLAEHEKSKHRPDAYKPKYESAKEEAEKLKEKVEDLEKQLKEAKKKPTARRKSSRKKKAKTKEKAAPKSTRKSPAQVIEKEINDIRQAQQKPESADLKKELSDLAQKKDNKSYLAYIRKKLQAASNDGVQLSKAEVIKLGRMIQPLIQQPRGVLQDTSQSNRQRLAPTYNNLLRWSNRPGQYDLIGVDVEESARPTVKAREVKKARIFSLLGMK